MFQAVTHLFAYQSGPLFNDCHSMDLGVVTAMLVDLRKIDAVASGDCECTAPSKGNTCRFCYRLLRWQVLHDHIF